MKRNAFLILLICPIITTAQNVGVGTTNPVERLDVNGNINVTGTIKTNGVDGEANQVLMKNTAGELAWGDLCDYRNLATFTSSGPGTWTVPAGITRIVVEAWGGGAGGSSLAGGGGGGYVRARFVVTPGQVISYVVGGQGVGVSTDLTNANGQSSSVTVGSYAATATGGAAGGGTITNMTVPTGGAGFISGIPLYTDFIGITGQIGKFAVNTFFTNGTTNYEYISGGDGGDCGNSVNTGSTGRVRLQTATSPSTLVKLSATNIARQPGGGGGSGYTVVTSGTTAIGSMGGVGMVAIRW